MDLVRFGKNLLFALALLAIVALLHESNLPGTQRLEEYIAFVLTTDMEYRPRIDVSQTFNLFGEGADVRNWWGRWRNGAPAAPAGAPAPSFQAAPVGTDR